MEWKLIAKLIAMILGILALVWAVPAILIWQIYYSKGNRNAAIVLSDGRIEFPPTQWQFVIWPFVSGYSAYAVFSFTQHHQWSVWNLILICTLLAAAFEELRGFPGTIAITREGLEQMYWLRRNAFIPWNTIVEINTGAKIKIVTIKAADGAKIVHTRNLADRPRLLKELKRYCSNQLPPDFPEE